MGFNSAFKGLSHYLAQGHVNPLKAELNPIYHFLALLGAHPILSISGLRVKLGN